MSHVFGHSYSDAARMVGLNVPVHVARRVESSGAREAEVRVAPRARDVVAPLVLLNRRTALGTKLVPLGVPLQPSLRRTRKGETEQNQPYALAAPSLFHFFWRKRVRKI
jgi:hypothetical protein